MALDIVPSTASFGNGKANVAFPFVLEKYQRLRRGRGGHRKRCCKRSFGHRGIGGFFPQRMILKKPRNQLRVERMARPMGHQTRL
jgi:hypothetical protein